MFVTENNVCFYASVFGIRILVCYSLMVAASDSYPEHRGPGEEGLSGIFRKFATNLDKRQKILLLYDSFSQKLGL